MALWCSQTRRSTACQFGEQRLAKLRPSLTAILGYEEHQAFERVDFGTLDELAPALFGFDEPCLGQGGKVGRKCALRQARSLDESAGGKSFRLVLDKQPERVESCGMCERGQGRPEEGRVGKGVVRRCKSRWWPVH